MDKNELLDMERERKKNRKKKSDINQRGKLLHITYWLLQI